jgi:RNA polymerase sigma factor (sigma-70 family)
MTTCELPPRLSPDERARVEALARAGDVESRNALTVDLYRMVAKLARRHVGGFSPEDVEDATQEAALHVMQKYGGMRDTLDDGRPGAGASTYAFYVAKNKLRHCVNVMVREGGRYRPVAFGDSVPEPVDERDDEPSSLPYDNPTEVVREVLSRLPARSAQVLRMRFGIGCPPQKLADIGRALGVTRERARQLEARGLEDVAARLDVMKAAPRKPPKPKPAALDRGSIVLPPCVCPGCPDPSWGTAKRSHYSGGRPDRFRLEPFGFSGVGCTACYTLLCRWRNHGLPVRTQRPRLTLLHHARHRPDLFPVSLRPLPSRKES